jgi:hypothetical protein
MRSAVSSSSKRKGRTGKPIWIARIPRAQRRCNLPTPGGPCLSTPSVLADPGACGPRLDPRELKVITGRQDWKAPLCSRAHFVHPAATSWKVSVCTTLPLCDGPLCETRFASCRPLQDNPKARKSG